MLKKIDLSWFTGLQNKHVMKQVIKIVLIALISIAALCVVWYIVDGRKHDSAMQYEPEDVQAPNLNILSNHPVEVVVHRGATYAAPENTYAAAAECIRLGVDYVEVDVHKSMDGVHYIIHDLTLDRTTNGKGPIFLRHSNYIDQLDAGTWYNERFRDEPVPRLREYLQWINGRAKVYLDVKTADLEKVILMIREQKMEESVFFWFGRDSMARDFNKLAPDLTLKMAARSFSELRRAIEEFDADMIECSLGKLTPEMIQLCRAHKVRIMTKGGDNSPEHFRKVMNSEAGLVNLGRPDIYIETLRNTMGKHGLDE